MKLTLMSGAGNRFVVLDGFAGALPSDLPALARAACVEVESNGGARPDGLLVAAKPSRGGDAAMILYNADGSRPETCGNGLRCIAKFVRDRGHVARDDFVLESDAGPCPTRVERVDGRIARARVHMGRPRIVARDVSIALPPETEAGRDAGSPARPGTDVAAAGVASVTDATRPRGPHSEADENLARGTLVDVGNPHCVIFVADERQAPVTTQGPRIERHAMFPRGTNVEYLAVRSARVFVRVWERGVGETEACGSGACAAAVAAVERGLARFPVRVELRGGPLEVDDDGAGGVFLTGPVEEIGTCEWTPGQPVRIGGTA